MCVRSICDVCGGGDVSSVLTVGHVQNVSAVTCVGLARREEGAGTLELPVSG